ncbi:MAG: response regulator [bacterium]|nr:response regulator [bacterium]
MPNSRGINEAMKRILVVEDDEMQRYSMTIQLQNAGYEVLEAPDGRIGSRIARARPCDLIISDIFMPERTGLEMILELKAESSHPKILVISGGGQWTIGGEYWSEYFGMLDADDILEIADNFNIDCSLRKPVDEQRLLRAVKELLDTV